MGTLVSSVGWERAREQIVAEIGSICAREGLLRRYVSAKELTGREGVGVAVDDLPLAVFAAIDMGDAQGKRRDRAAVHGEGGVFIAPVAVSLAGSSPVP